MNAERLHAIAISLNQEILKGNVVGKLQELINALQQVVNQPHPSHHQNLANQLNGIYAVLTDTSSDAFSPAWRQILSEIGGEELFGTTMKEAIKNVFERNQITSAVALQELQQLQKKLQAFKTALDQCIAAFREFKIGDEKLAPGDCEVGILIPRKAIDDQLLDFADELKELGFILNTFAEVATGKKDKLSIRTISSSDLLVYLNAVAPYAACLAFAIERTVALYKKLLEIRKLHQEIRKQGVPDDQTAGIENYANQLMGDGIDKVSLEIVEQFYKGKDKARKNELTNSVRISLNKLANRIDQGFNLEVRVEPMPKDVSGRAENATLQKAITLIQSATTNMQFLKLEGKPILSLPEGKEKRKKKEVHSNKVDSGDDK